MDKTVIVWSKPDCVECEKLKKHLKREQIPFIERNLMAPAHEPQLTNFIMNHNVKAAPVLEYGDEIIPGYFYGQVQQFVERYKSEHVRG